MKLNALSVGMLALRNIIMARIYQINLQSLLSLVNRASCQLLFSTGNFLIETVLQLGSGSRFGDRKFKIRGCDINLLY